MTGDSIGRVVGVHGFHVRVELHAGQRSPVRACLDGVETQIKINAYVTFEIGAGESVLGIVTDLDSREVFEPGDEQLTLELTRPRRLASVQVLGTVRSVGDGAAGKYHFDPGVNILPTLDTLAVPARREILAAVLTDAPRRNEVLPTAKDGALLIGQSTAAPDKEVFGSFNDLLSRPLAVVGNTGSGKSCTIAHLLQQLQKSLPAPTAKQKKRPRVFILDINGEYSTAFAIPSPKVGREPNKIYVNGKEFTVPLWLMNAQEVCQWLSAAEQVQEPTLKQFWSLAKGGTDDVTRTNVLLLRLAATHCESLLGLLGSTAPYVGQKIKKSMATVLTCVSKMDAKAAYVKELSGLATELKKTTNDTVVDDHNLKPEKEPDLQSQIVGMRDKLFEILSGQEQSLIESADKPLHIDLALLRDPKRLTDAAKVEGMESQFGQLLRGLQLRLANRLSDKRWHCLRNYDDIGVKSAVDWFAQLGITSKGSCELVIIDCSMLSFEVLPYVCGMIGRMLLEVREFVSADKRFNDPWVLVLEEAHNYIRPKRQEESRGILVSREVFERIAKEGRKFGLSLVVASQRPSDISPTVLSQCANFIIHRLQNPDDIEHFRKIVPSQSRRLMDQITILRAGEGIVVGSGFHIPSRVQVKRPHPEPSSKSSTPFTSWLPSAEAFGIDEATKNWLG